MPTFTLKAKNVRDAKAIIVSFHAKWTTALQDGAVQVVFRKKGPTKCQPRTMYAYISSPLSSIVARFPVSEVNRMTIDDAVGLCDDGQISEKSLRKYAEGKDDLFVIRIGTPSIAESPISLQTLMSAYDFWPTANFISLSEEGAKELDAIGKFQS